VKCNVCRGACCESLTIPSTVAAPWMSMGEDTGDWIRLHGVHVEARRLTFECRCSALTPEGQCALYETVQRPLTCISYPAGGENCLDAVRRRRTPEQYQQIRHDADPKVLL
jgi:hypothetical protein